MSPVALAALLTLADLAPEPARSSCLIPVERCEETRLSSSVTMKTCSTIIVPCAEALDLRLART